MICDKCGFPHMVDDSESDIKVYRCWVCGNRTYLGYPKRSGSLVCMRCGGETEEENDLSYCRNCLKLLNIDERKTHRLTFATAGNKVASAQKKML